MTGWMLSTCCRCSAGLALAPLTAPRMLDKQDKRDAPNTEPLTTDTTEDAGDTALQMGTPAAKTTRRLELTSGMTGWTLLTCWIAGLALASTASLDTRDTSEALWLE